ARASANPAAILTWPFVLGCVPSQVSAATVKPIRSWATTIGEEAVVGREAVAEIVVLSAANVVLVCAWMSGGRKPSTILMCGWAARGPCDETVRVRGHGRLGDAEEQQVVEAEQHQQVIRVVGGHLGADHGFFLSQCPSPYGVVRALESGV